jgi:outer membrane protein assembly factor BamD (BamD/ComL family)
MKRLFKKQMNKRPKRRTYFFVFGLLIVIISSFIFSRYYIAKKPLSDYKYQQLYAKVQESINKQDYEAALKDLKRLDSSSKGNDYRIYAAYADVYNYKMDKEEAKRYASLAIDAYNKNSANANNSLLLRMDSYINRVFLPNPALKTSTDKIPKSQVEQEGFQG